MYILTSWSALDIDTPDAEELKNGLSPELLVEIISALKNAYDDAATDSESYIYEDGIEAENFTLGAVDAEQFLDEVSSWIPNIRSNFVANLENVYTPGMDPADIKVNTTMTYTLQQAARALDNSWHSYSPYGSYLENSMGYPYFRVFPNTEQMAAMKEHPEEYFIVDVYVKS